MVVLNLNRFKSSSAQSLKSIFIALFQCLSNFRGHRTLNFGQISFRSIRTIYPNRTKRLIFHESCIELAWLWHDPKLPMPESRQNNTEIMIIWLTCVIRISHIFWKKNQRYTLKTPRSIVWALLHSLAPSLTFLAQRSSFSSYWNIFQEKFHSLVILLYATELIWNSFKSSKLHSRISHDLNLINLHFQL